jgi:hypothetical protein
MLRLLWPFLSLLLLKEGDAGEEEEEEEDGEEEEEEHKPKLDKHGKPIRDSRIKELSDEAAKWRKKFREAEARVIELEGEGKQKKRSQSFVDGQELREARLESAFVRAVFEHRDSIDLEAAWDLATYKGFLDAVTVDDDDGTVDSDTMTEALERLIDRYPYLIDGKSEPSGENEDEPKPKTRHPVQRHGGKKIGDRASLEKRFPALRGRRRSP